MILKLVYFLVDILFHAFFLESSVFSWSKRVFFLSFLKSSFYKFPAQLNFFNAVASLSPRSLTRKL